MLYFIGAILLAVVGLVKPLRHESFEEFANNLARYSSAKKPSSFMASKSRKLDISYNSCGGLMISELLNKRLNIPEGGKNNAFTPAV